MMIRKLGLAALAVVAFGGQLAHAKSQPCRDAKGKFTKCEAPKKPKPCRDAKGKFTKCDAPAPQAAQPSN
ncbi:hypothetical protein QMA67_07035 [Gluconobacter japonicus]|uniref:Phosphate starvation-inducible protein PsiF n=2 Tax=Gluconobacter japonicus TaxID=376620 RepID=A0A149S4F8_GLUJA|nr:hypothetical protein [Gluconobacter japonicus]GAP23448.1 hypothetical protein GLF_0330 [Gluconobacter frateurii NBRC 101659]KXV21473.1 hypothetical protein AD935_07375 [Gluconobacter japonicus]KXV26273.1 hypothetical protein AD937_07765 [Gluconobacter japonicus]KXV41583.1 hypothetical protein AD942_02015 [Gluconobacter japonicus]MBF0871285.1 hypothetical protein [Gluconobacter japonicus]